MSKLSYAQYNPQVGINVTDYPDIQASADKLAASLQNFNTAVQTVPQKMLAEEAENQRQALQNNISTTYKQFAENAVENRNGAKGLTNYDAQSKAYAANVLATVHGSQKKYTENLLNYYSNEHRITVQQKVFQQAQLSAFAGFVEHNAQQTNDIMAAVHNSSAALGEHQFDAAQQLQAIQIKGWKNALVQGIVSKSEFASAYRSMQENFQLSSSLKQYSDALNSGKSDKFVESYLNKNVPFLSDVQKIRSALPLFKALNNAKASELALDTENIKRMSDDSISGVKQGGMPNAAVESILEQTGQDKKLQDYRERLEDAKYYYGAIQELITTPVGKERQQVLDRYLPTDLKDASYGRDLRLYNEIKNGISNYQQSIDKDAVTFYRQHPFIQDVLNRRINAEGIGATAEYQPNSAINDPVQTAIKSVVDLQQISGRNFYGPEKNMVRVMGNDDVKSTISQIMNAEPMQKIGMLNGLRDYYKEYYPLALNDLKNGGLSPNMQILGRINPNNPYLEQLTTGLTTPTNILTDKNVLDPDTRKNIDDSINQVRTTSIFGTAIKQAAQAVYNVVQGRSLVAFSNLRGQINTAPSGNSSVDFQNLMDSYDGFAGGGDPKFKQTMYDSVKNMSYALAANTKASLSAGDAVDVAMNSLAGNYNYTKDGQQTLRIPQQYNPEVVMRYAENEKAKLEHFNFAYDQSTNLTPTQSKEGYYLREVKPGHWVNDQFDRGLIWVSASGKVLVDSDMHPFHILFDDAHNSVETTQMHKGKQLLSPVQETKLGNNISLTNAFIENGMNTGFTP